MKNESFFFTYSQRLAASAVNSHPIVNHSAGALLLRGIVNLTTTQPWKKFQQRHALRYRMNHARESLGFNGKVGCDRTWNVAVHCSANMCQYRIKKTFIENPLWLQLRNHHKNRFHSLIESMRIERATWKALVESAYNRIDCYRKTVFSVIDWNWQTVRKKGKTAIIMEFSDCECRTRFAFLCNKSEGKQFAQASLWHIVLCQGGEGGLGMGNEVVFIMQIYVTTFM